jgi:predicted glycosyltransferase
MRIALYSPGMVGLGHLRRNLLLARRFAAIYPDAAFLMLAEAREAGIFAWPDNVDCLTLPAVRKTINGQCTARRLRINLPDLMRLRAAALEAALTHFAPDILVVDHLPLGALGELGRSLDLLRRTGTRLVLGLRDILEEPDTVREEWERAGHEQTIADMYEAVWIYGDRAVYDPFSEYSFSAAVTSKTQFTGYLNPITTFDHAEPANADDLATRLLDNRRVILCQLGGGQDGVRLGQAFVDAELPDDAVGVLVAGPFMPRAARESLMRLARLRRGRVQVLSLIAEPTELLRHAERVITMGGYNSACEVVALRKHALVVPRTRPRQEQLIRSQRFAALGLIDMLEPAKLSSRSLSEWIAQPAPDPGSRTYNLDMNGLERASEYLRDLLPEPVSEHVGTASL